MTNLQVGDCIGVISPSSPIASFCPLRLKRGCDYLQKQGFKILLGNNVSSINKFTAGTTQNRVDDIHAMFCDNQVKAIIMTIGGYNANDLLGVLDYQLVKKNNNKLFIGYSDSTILLHALYKKSGVPCIMGPMILPQFGEYPEMFPFSWKSFLDVAMNLGSNKIYDFQQSDSCTEEFLSWDLEDVRPRKMKQNSGWDIVFGGKASGILIPANLNTLCHLIGTEYMLDLNNAILFLEDDADESASTVQRMLQHMKCAGCLDNIKGIVFGRFQEKSSVSREDIHFVLNNVFGAVTFPVISNVDFGHTDPLLSLPLGKEVTLDTDMLKISVVL
jgi:muramoyltetrapeptide carboxypeptidase